MTDLDFADFYFNRLFAVGCGLLRCGMCIGTGMLHAAIETPTGELTKQTNSFAAMKKWVAETLSEQQTLQGMCYEH